MFRMSNVYAVNVCIIYSYNHVVSVQTYYKHKTFIDLHYKLVSLSFIFCIFKCKNLYHFYFGHILILCKYHIRSFYCEWINGCNLPYIHTPRIARVPKALWVSKVSRVRCGIWMGWWILILWWRYTVCSDWCISQLEWLPSMNGFKLFYILSCFYFFKPQLHKVK